MQVVAILFKKDKCICPFFTPSNCLPVFGFQIRIFTAKVMKNTKVFHR